MKIIGIRTPSGELIWTETGERFDIGPNETFRTPDDFRIMVGRLFLYDILNEFKLAAYDLIIINRIIRSIGAIFILFIYHKKLSNLKPYKTNPIFGQNLRIN